MSMDVSLAMRPTGGFNACLLATEGQAVQQRIQTRRRSTSFSIGILAPDTQMLPFHRLNLILRQYVNEAARQSGTALWTLGVGKGGWEERFGYGYNFLLAFESDLPFPLLSA
jgi:hypothetical protein